MKGYELRTNFCLLRDVEKENINVTIINCINNVMETDEYLKLIHISKGFKGYSVSSAVPFELDYYREAEMYSFKVRSTNLKLIQKLRVGLRDYENEYMMILDVDVIVINNNGSIIEKIETVSPAIATFSNENKKTLSWTKDMGFEKLENQLFNNMVKKYRFLTGDDDTDIIKQDIIKSIELRNSIPVVLKYKNNSKLIGYKYIITFNENELAQKIANTAYFQGVLGKNSSLCCGFTKAYYKGKKVL